MSFISVSDQRITLLLLIATALSPRFTHAQSPLVVEVTKQDFLALPKIVSTKLSTFGIQLGMTREQADASLIAFSAQAKVRSVDKDLRRWAEMETDFPTDRFIWSESREQVRARLEAEHVGRLTWKAPRAVGLSLAFTSNT